MIFLLTYAAAQLLAGGKALHVLLDWPTWSGAVVGAILVSLYCVAGGIRASIWTDAAQSVVMITAMTTLLIVALIHLGGPSNAYAQMQSIKGFTELAPKSLAFASLAGIALFFVSWLCAGFSVVGQPHIMVRFMALESSGSMQRAKLWYYLWFSAFYCMATAVGLLSRIYLPDTAVFDAELALPTMAQSLLPPVFTGIILAGIFAATMSTADSLVLSCSAAVTNDLSPKRIDKTWILKISTIVLTCLALILALTNNQSVFNMVIMSWSGLASAFCPLLLFLCAGYRPGQTTSIIAVCLGFSVALVWRLFGLHNAVYEGLPGILAGIAILLLACFNQKYTASTHSDK